MMLTNFQVMLNEKTNEIEEFARKLATETAMSYKDSGSFLADALVFGTLSEIKDYYDKYGIRGIDHFVYWKRMGV